jgi:hypothetical protein
LANFAQGRLNSAFNPGIFDNGPIWARVWRDDLDASGPTINLRRDRSDWIMFLLIASCNS